MSSVPTVNVSLDDSKKIFVGNLPFNVTNDILSAYFSVCGKVDSAKIITRGNRSLGYGFVTFSKEEDAVSAHSKFNHQMFEGREINVELAKPKTQEPFVENGNGSKGVTRPRGNNRFRRGGRRNNSNANTNVLRQNMNKSQTSLFIANLPFEMNDESFADIFSEYTIESAHIVTSRNGQSRGYGFVKFGSAAEQKRALADLQNCMINDRPITVRVALEHPEPTAQMTTTTQAPVEPVVA